MPAAAVDSDEEAYCDGARPLQFAGKPHQPPNLVQTSTSAVPNHDTENGPFAGIPIPQMVFRLRRLTPTRDSASLRPVHTKASSLRFLRHCSIGEGSPVLRIFPLFVGREAHPVPEKIRGVP